MSPLAVTIPSYHFISDWKMLIAQDILLSLTSQFSHEAVEFGFLVIPLGQQETWKIRVTLVT
jgi:hypothetical protein